MADKEHFELAMRDVNAWNKWREENPKEKPDLSFAVMRGADLMLANLSGALLYEADLVLANLRGADLRHADLRGANLVGARLIGRGPGARQYLRRGSFDRRGSDRGAAPAHPGRCPDQLPEDMHAPENWPKKGRTAGR
jgi:hypothetical protein